MVESGAVMTNPFSILGIPDTSSPAEVKAAWRELSKKHHPDHGGDAEKFQELKDAYTRALKKAADAPCPECKGEGKITKQQGFNTLKMACPVCKGLKLRYK